MFMGYLLTQCSGTFLIYLDSWCEDIQVLFNH